MRLVNKKRKRVVKPQVVDIVWLDVIIDNP